MIFAIGIALFLFLGAWTRYSRYFYYSGMALLFFFVVMRSAYVSGNPDAYIYYSFFQRSPSLKDFNFQFWDYNASWGFGWGYGLLNAIAKSISRDYFVFQFINAVLVFSLLSMILKKSELTYKDKCFFLFVYFCSKFIWYFFILLRQNVANLIIWYILIDYDKNRKKKFWYTVRDLMLILIAMSFHSTAALFFIVYPFYIYLSKHAKGKSIVLLSLIGTFVLTFLSEFIFSSLMLVLSFIDSTHFSGSSYNMKVNGNVNYINYSLRICYLIVIYLYARASKKYKNVLICSSLAVFVGGLNHELVIRIVEYFAIGFYFGLGKVRQEIGNKKNSELLVLFVLFVYLVFLLQYIMVNNTPLITYKFYDASRMNMFYIGGQ